MCAVTKTKSLVPLLFAHQDHRDIRTPQTGQQCVRVSQYSVFSIQLVKPPLSHTGRLLSPLTSVPTSILLPQLCALHSAVRPLLLRRSSSLATSLLKSIDFTWSKSQALVCKTLNHIRPNTLLFMINIMWYLLYSSTIKLIDKINYPKYIILISQNNS